MGGGGEKSGGRGGVGGGERKWAGEGHSPAGHLLRNRSLFTSALFVLCCVVL